MNNQVKLIEALRKIQEQASLGNFSGNPDNAALRINNILKIADEALMSSDTPPVPTIKPGDKVRHYRRGEGIVLKVYEDKVIANFNGVSVGCKPGALEVVE